MDISEFLEKSYTCYAAVENGTAMLEAAGFVPLTAQTKVVRGKGYYRVSGGCLLAAKAGDERLQIAVSHTDSPSLRVRYTPGESAVTLDVERYGGGLLRSYLDRKMKIAGRVICRDGNAFVARTVCSDFNVVIPSLAVHLGAGREEEKLTVSCDLRPFIGACDDLYAALGAPDAVDAELFCVPAEAPFVCGASGEYLCAPRIDNLVSVYAGIRAIAACKPAATAVIACFNSEEVGSETRDGARAQLVRAFIEELGAAAGWKTSADALLRGAFVLSCDGAHAKHPSHGEKYVSSAPTAGGGVAIKRHDNYATDALTAAVVREVFASAGAATQTYYHHADLRCGSTIGKMAAQGWGAYVCDLGVAQFAMHSAAETAALRDIADLEKGLTAFFTRSVTVREDAISVQ